MRRSCVATAPGLHGRETEIAALEHHIAALENGHSAIVAVTGPAGSGKTRLLDEAARIAGTTSVRVHRGIADPATAAVPLASLLDALLHGPHPIIDSGRLQALSGRPDAVFWIVQELHDCLERAALEAPIIVALDDVQWIDDATLIALRTLSRHLAGHPILWVLAFRSGAAAERLALEDAARIELGPLDDAAVAAVAGDLLGCTPDDALLELVAQAGGRPFLVVELLRGLIEEGLTTVSDGRAVLSVRRLPLRLRGTVARQLDRLSLPAREAVQMASLLGRHFGADELAALLERPPSRLVGPLDEALESELLVAEEGALTFRHDLLRQAVEASLPTSLARTLRKRAITVMTELGVPATEVAVPAMAVAEAGDDEAIEALRRAAADVAATAPAQAATLLRRVLELTPAHHPRRASVVREALPILHAAGQLAEARRLGDGVLRQSLPAADEAAVRLGIARLSLQRDYPEAARQCGTALDLRGVPRPLRLHLRTTLATARVLEGSWQAARRDTERNLADARAEADAAAEVAALYARAVISAREHRYGVMLQYSSAAQALAERAGPEAKAAFPDVVAAWLHHHVGRPEETLRLAKDGLSSAQRDGRAADLVWWVMCRSTALLSLGRLSDARAEAEGALELIADLRHGSVSTAPYVLGRVALHTGDRGALADAATAAADMRADETLTLRRQGEWLGALLADAAGDQAGARRLLCGTVADIGRLTPTLAQAPDPMDLIVLLRVLLRCGDRAGSRAVTAEAERRAAMNRPFALLGFVAAHARALVDGRPQALLASVDTADIVPSPVGRASILEDAGHALSRHAADRAVALLDDALALYDEVGADHDAGRVRSRLRELGVRRHRRRSPTGPCRGLTESESAVVRLVAAGATNREAAERLYLSPHTVTSHLRHAFTKLHITSRVELAALVARGELDDSAHVTSPSPGAPRSPRFRLQAS